MNSNKSKWQDPGIILVGVLVLVAAIILIWWPTDIYVMGISLAGWLMFLSYFAWFAISVVYVIWIERLEAQQNQMIDAEEEEQKKA